MEITRSQEVKAPVEKVWNIVADLDNEHKNWSFLRDVKILSKSKNSVEREVKVRRGPMGEAKSVHTLSIDPSKQVTKLTLTKGPMIGTRTLSLKKLGDNLTEIDVGWNFDVKGVPGFAKGFVSDNVSEVTEKALEQIAKVAEASK